MNIGQFAVNFVGVPGCHNSIFSKTTVTLRAKIPWLIENFTIGLSYTGFDQYSLTNSIRADFSTHGNDITANISPLDAWKF